MQGHGAAEQKEGTGAPELAEGGKATGCKPRIWGARVTASPSLPHPVGTVGVLLWGPQQPPHPQSSRADGS